MTLGELIGPEALLPAPWLQVPILGLTADSRAVRPGYLFAALPGTRTDGSRFIAEALARGAAAILMPQGGAHAVNGTPFDGTSFSGTPVVEDANPRRRLALIAARFFGAQPEIAVAVTGTNGKTSVASFTRQLWEQQGLRAASLGTVGVVGPLGMQSLAHTTPDPVELHHILASLAKSGVTHLALEASSHGLEQRRIDGVRTCRRRLHQHLPRPSRLSPELRGLFRREASPCLASCCRRAPRRSSTSTVRQVCV